MSPPTLGPCQRDLVCIQLQGQAVDGILVFKFCMSTCVGGGEGGHWMLADTVEGVVHNKYHIYIKNGNNNSFQMQDMEGGNSVRINK